jgi:hypothetical protein
MKEQTGTWRPPGAGTVDAQNPWPGLAAFREADREFFKGREAVIDDLARLVLRAPVTVLFGVSGLGKTSLLRAGLFPVLRQNGLLPVYVRLQHAEGGRTLREQVFQALSEATAVGGVESEEPDPGSSLWEHMHRKDVRFWNERNRLVTPLIVVDQSSPHGCSGMRTGRWPSCPTATSSGSGTPARVARVGLPCGTTDPSSSARSAPTAHGCQRPHSGVSLAEEALLRNA